MDILLMSESLDILVTGLLIGLMIGVTLSFSLMMIMMKSHNKQETSLYKIKKNYTKF